MAMTAEQYAQQLAALLPPGTALSVVDDSDLAQLLTRLGAFLADVDTRADIITKEMDPRQSIHRLGEWETSMGLPDSCTVGTQAVRDRQMSVYSKMIDPGGARAPRYLRLAETLGYPGATIHRFPMHTCEQSCETPIYERAWRFVWALHVPIDTRIVDSTAESGCEEPLRTWGDAVLSCVMQREAPAMSQVIILYGATR